MARTSQISDEVWANAIRAVMVDRMSLRVAAQKFGVHHMSLHRRIKDIRGDGNKAATKARASPGGGAASGAASASFQMQPGMSMVNMMQMPMDSSSSTGGARPPPPPSAAAYVSAGPRMRVGAMMHEGGVPPPPPIRPHAQFPGVENSGSNTSNMAKARNAVRMRQLDIHQASATFQVDPNELHEYLRGDIEYLNPADEHGLLNVVAARLDLGVKMSYDELVDLIQRLLHERDPRGHLGALSDGMPFDIGVAGRFELILEAFTRRNEQFLHQAMESPSHPSPSSRNYSAYNYPTPSPHHQQAPLQRPVLLSQVPRAAPPYSDSPEGGPPVSTSKRGLPPPGYASLQQDRTYSPSSNLLIASNKINVKQEQQQHQQADFYPPRAGAPPPRRPESSDDAAPPAKQQSSKGEMGDVVEV
ncbi:Aste57867_21232 [Aphanomyces stellatus]|uniref:Aste57867_21232 protein n=1 Tax=Aphanomyces stellatus TaxID=120398 RepID=A0A485LHK5_9STRA|nr:hypothetical protein As57867_021164 [Aphanomyces stellatus]VFT97904.1 Aste57867_21232 [Aphanomyces stellatus]